MSQPSCREGVLALPLLGRISYRFWQSDQPQALLVLLHGFGEHGGRYLPFAEALCGRGISVVAPDFWAHGRSEGAKGDLGDVGRRVEELRTLVEQVWLPESGQSRYALFGHSFGGLAAAYWAVQAPPGLSRVVLQSPLFEVGFPLPRWKTVAAWVLSACWPKFKFALNLDIGALSRDAAIGDAYRRDPLVHNVMTAGTYVSLLRTRDRTLARAAECRAPVLLLCGTGDRIISVDAALAWFERLSGQKRLVEFTEAFHELHHEPVRQDVIELTADWVLADAAR
jgi:alpha-beta hydrolase superfamily lysophospholipase